MTISRLRTLVKNGWTIANRKNLTSKIGIENYNELTNKALNANLLDTFQYSNATKYLDTYNIEKTKELLDNINKSYKSYAQSPFINDYLRNNMVLSENSKLIVDSLKEAIKNGKVSGNFARGLTPTKNNKLETIEDVSNFIFNNKGFTSVVPKAHADYANCFALGRNSVKVEFDIKSMHGYKACPYEVLFAPEAFTPDKFSIIKTGERLYKVLQL